MIRWVYSFLRKSANQSDEELKRGSSETLNVASFGLGGLRKAPVFRYSFSCCRGARILLNPETREPLTRPRLYHRMVALGKRAGVPNAHPHRFRDTFAVDMLARGWDSLRRCQAASDTVDTIEKHYAPFVKQLRDRVRGLMENGEGTEKTNCTNVAQASRETQNPMKVTRNKALSPRGACIGYSVSCTWASFAKPCP